MLNNSFRIKTKSLFIVLVLCSIIGCTDRSKENISVYRFIISGLNHSDTIITYQNIDHLHSIMEKLEDPQTKEKASIWYPKALMIKEKTKVLTDYIDSLKQEVKSGSGSTLVYGKETFREQDPKSVGNIFIEQHGGNKLRQKLVEFKNEMLVIDSGMAVTFAHEFDNTLGIVPSNQSNFDFENLYFKDVSAIACVALLTQLEVNVKVIASHFLGYCRNVVPQPDHGHIRI